MGPRAQRQAEPAPSRGTIDPRVERILRDVSTFLGAKPTIRFYAEITYDEIQTLDDAIATDARVQYGGRTEFTVSRPDKLRVSYRSDEEQWEVFVDGRTVTMLAPTENIYTTLNAGGTIDQALDALWEKVGTAPPLADLVYRDPYARLAPNIVSGSYVGLHDVGGVPCHHLFLAQETADWQLWVDAGERPLPRRIVITYRELPQAPVFAADFGGWDFAPSLAAEAFSFKPPEGAIAVEAVTTSIAGRGFREDR